MNDDELKYIDDFYKKGLSNYQKKASEKTWRKMRWILFWMRYRWFIVGLSVLAIALLMSNFAWNMSSSKTGPIVNSKVPVQDVIVVSSNPMTPNKTAIVSTNEIIDYKEKSGLTIKETESNNDYIQSLESPKELSHVREEIKKADKHTLLLTEIISKNNNPNIAPLPDTNIFGYNRRLDIKSFERKKSILNINIYAGPSLPISNISGYNSEYLNVRNTNESNKSSWLLGADIKLHLKNWVITTGINYSVYNQSRSYKNNYQEYSPDDSYFQYDTIWVWFFDPPDFGVPIMVGVDSNWVKVYNTVTVDNSGINQISYFEIPFLIGYQFNTNMVQFEINSGINVGFLHTSKVKVPSFTDYSEIVDAGNMSKIMYNFMANVTVYYKINSSTRLFVSPYYKQNLKSVFNDDYPINQTFTTYGVNFGVSLRF